MTTKWWIKVHYVWSHKYKRCLLFAIGRLPMPSSIWSNRPLLSLNSLSSGKNAFLGQGLEVARLVLEEDRQRLDQDFPTRAGEQRRRDRLGSVRRLPKKFAFKSLLNNSSICFIRLDSCWMTVIYFLFSVKRKLVVLTVTRPDCV